MTGIEVSKSHWNPKSLTCASFIESLSAKVHNTPPSIEKLSGIFQDFYTKAEAHVTTHIRALSARQSRVVSPSPSVSSKSSVSTRDGTKAAKKEVQDVADVGTSEQQMLTPREISDRRKARRLLDRKTIALEEAVERRVCERVYNRIWRHRSALDEVRDEKLRSRTAALALVGISLDDLGITFEPSSGKESAELESEIDDWISKARDGLLRMNEARFPLGKLQQLAAAHKSIVDLLTALHQSSSSADEILPTLIYALITTPPEGINIISNLQFIQRFRSASKVDGEAAYCLTNLEAAITFLETVDLASLRADEALEGPPKPSSRTSTPVDDSRPESASITSPATPSIAAPIPISAGPINNPPTLAIAQKDLDTLPRSSLSKPPAHHRRLSDLLHPPAHALGAASDAVRSTADQGIKTIGSTLDNSFKLLFGKLQEQKVASEGTDADKPIVVPKTLDDARKLVEPKPDNDDEESARTPITNGRRSEDSILGLIAGHKMIRDRSIDSNNSSGSGKRVAFTGENKLVDRAVTSNPLLLQTEPASAGASAVESMRNLGNSLNPLRGFSGMGGLRAFGRTASSGPTNPIQVHTGAVVLEKPTPPTRDSTVNKGFSDSLPPIKVAPPIPKFIDTKSATDLKLGEVSDLLSDYKRLARVLEQLGAF